MTGFPSPFTVNADVLLSKSAEQNITNFLESGNDYDDLHTAARAAIVDYLHSHGTDASLVENPDSYKSAAVNWFLSKLFAAERDFDKADWYSKQFLFEMKERTRPLISNSVANEGGQLGKITIEKRNASDARGTGGSNHYGNRRVGRRFGR